MKLKEIIVKIGLNLPIIVSILAASFCLMMALGLVFIGIKKSFGLKYAIIVFVSLKIIFWVILLIHQWHKWAERKHDETGRDRYHRAQRMLREYPVPAPLQVQPDYKKQAEELLKENAELKKILEKKLNRNSPLNGLEV